MRRFVARPLHVALVLAAAAAGAQEPTKLAPVEVVETYENAIGLWDAASQGAVTREGIERRPLERPAEVLEAIPGMAVTQHSGDGKANQDFLRGYNLDHGTDFATWVAGMPVNMPTHAHGQGYMDLNFMIPELVSRILYSKGPYFAENGDFASVGTARIEYAYALPATVATVTAGSFGYLRGLATGAPEVGPGRLVYGLEYVQGNGPWEHPNKLSKLNGVARFAVGTPANGLDVTAMAYEGDWNATDQIPRRAVKDGALGRFGAVDTSDGGKASRYSLSAQWRQSGESLSGAASLYVVRSKLSLWSNFTYFLDDEVNGDQFEQAEKRTFGGGEVAGTWAGLVAGRRVSNTLGLQFRGDRLSPVGLYGTVTRERTSTTREDRVTVSNVSPYFSNTVEWTGWFRTILGVRGDFYRFDVQSSLPENSGKVSDSLVSPKASAIFGPWAQTELFLNWGRGFHSNDARGTTTTIDPKTGDPVERVSALVPTTGYEAGVRTQYFPGFSGSVALWTLKQDSELLFVGDAGTTEPSRESKRTGVELLAQYSPVRWLFLDLSAAWTRARFTDDDPAGPYIPGAPDKIAGAGVAVDNLAGWFGALRWRYFGPRPLTEDGSVQSYSTSLFNARVGYAFTPKVRLWLDAFNLFNAKASDIDYFYVSRLPGEPAGGIADVHFHPVEPQQFRLTLSLAL